MVVRFADGPVVAHDTVDLPVRGVRGGGQIDDVVLHGLLHVGPVVSCHLHGLMQLVRELHQQGFGGVREADVLDVFVDHEPEELVGQIHILVRYHGFTYTV